MKKHSLRKYHKDGIIKDTVISFMGGVGAGLTVWYFGFIFPDFLGSILGVLLGLALFAICGGILLLLMIRFCTWYFAKK